MQIPVNAPQGGATRISIDDCTSLEGTGIRTETLPESDQYMLQGEAFSRAVRGEIEFPYGVEDAIANMRVIDALFRSEANGCLRSHRPGLKASGIDATRPVAVESSPQPEA